MKPNGAFCPWNIIEGLLQKLSKLNALQDVSKTFIEIFSIVFSRYQKPIVSVTELLFYEVLVYYLLVETNNVNC
ncbi:CLUMA_CG014036, isoform A [Clunio marinus]|uniref:CLUMA_CG014036, isoform A n=1 Tax=Clunio marinus TaxID=568069 RepID=A0A1J1INW3_9DIPT|nr:CLUMA_CG014036, isoform A [Clunio marinus]